MKYAYILILTFACAFVQCKEDEIPVMELPDPVVEPEIKKDTLLESIDTLTFIALGDSYTIGQSVAVEKRWPIQLSEQIESLDYFLETDIIAQTGWTTADLKSAISRSVLKDNVYDYVGLLIGVNNQYRGYDIEIYRVEFEELLKMAIQMSGGQTNKVFVLSIPDYGYTPFGQANQAQISIQIDAYNAINLEISTTYKVEYFDITGISREALANTALVASDNLHPSGLMYEKWMNLVLPWLEEQIGIAK